MSCGVDVFEDGWVDFFSLEDLSEVVFYCFVCEMAFLVFSINNKSYCSSSVIVVQFLDDLGIFGVDGLWVKFSFCVLVLLGKVDDVFNCVHDVRHEGFEVIPVQVLLVEVKEGCEFLVKLSKRVISNVEVIFVCWVWGVG